MKNKISLRLDDETEEALEDLINKTGISKSKIIRKAIKDYNKSYTIKHEEEKIGNCHEYTLGVPVSVSNSAKIDVEKGEFPTKEEALRYYLKEGSNISNYK